VSGDAVGGKRLEPEPDTPRSVALSVGFATRDDDRRNNEARRRAASSSAPAAVGEFAFVNTVELAALGNRSAPRAAATTRSAKLTGRNTICSGPRH
jgi:hypothetical protein